MEKKYLVLEGRAPLDFALSTIIEGLKQEQLRIPLAEKMRRNALQSFQELRIAA